MKKLILILLSISFCLLCNADTYTYTSQLYHKNVEKLKLALEADGDFSGVVFSYIDYYGDDIDNLKYDINTAAPLDSGQQTALAAKLATYNVSNWASL